MTALARGLDVLEALATTSERMTSSEVAKATGLSRGTARRLLLTLQARNYVSSDSKHYWLTPRVMQFSNGYLLQNGLLEAARSVLPELSEAVAENVSLSVLDLPDIVYLQRHEISRIFSSGLEPGARLPAYCTSMGRVLLAALSEEELERYLSHEKLVSQTSTTLTTPSELRSVIHEVARQGYCIVDEELETGLRSVAVPVVSGGAVVAALNISTSIGRTKASILQRNYVPALQDAARKIEHNLSKWAKK